MTRSQGIVLHALRYGDETLIVEIFTACCGTVAFLVRVPRSRKGRAGAGVWQPLSLVEVVWEPRPLASLQKPRELTLWRPWRDLPFHPVKASVALFLGEFLHHALRREQENPRLFGFAAEALDWFDRSRADFANFHIVFLIGLTRYLGFFPNADGWHEGACFDLLAATFADVRPPHGYVLEPAEAAVLPRFLRMDFRSMRVVGLNGAARRRALEVITLYYRLHVPEFPELHSLDILSELFSS